MIVQPNYVYLIIPSEYVCIYHKLLMSVADFGKRILDDCDSTCKGEGKIVFNCWNLFQSAIACKELGKDKEADLFINYIDKQLSSLYKGTSETVYKGVFPITIDEEGKVKAIVSCGNTTTFEVDPSTGELIEKNNECDINSYSITDDNLTVNKK